MRGRGEEGGNMHRNVTVRYWERHVAVAGERGTRGNGGIEKTDTREWW